MNPKLNWKDTQTQTESDECPVVQYTKKAADKEKGHRETYTCTVSNEHEPRRTVETITGPQVKSRKQKAETLTGTWEKKPS